MAQRDYSIEYDFNHQAFEKALDEGRSLHSLCITEEFLDTQNTRPTEKRLEAILSKISEMWSLQGVYLSLQKTAIPGRLLPLAINPGLQELKVHSGLEIHSQQECEILAATLKENGLSLKRISFLNIKVRLNAMASLGRFGLGSHKPILDPLLEAVPDLEFLETFEISCHDSEQNNKGKPLISIDSLRSLCQSLSLKCLNLSNLAVGDEHFMAIAQELSKKPPTLQELILNENFNTELGVEMIIRMLLDTSSTTIRTFQAFQKTSQLSPACISLMRQVLEKHNTSLTNISISTSTDREKDTMRYFEQLNLAGRHLFLHKNCTAEDWIRLLESVNDNHSMIFYCLRQSKFWWNYIGLGRSLSRPLMKSKALSDTNNTGEQQTVGEVKVVVGESDNGEEDEKISEELLAHLKSQGMSEELELDYSENETNVSSQETDSYLDDLHRQKDTLVDSTREEALEEAHEIYEKQFGKGNVDEKVFLDLFYKTLSEKEKQMDTMYKHQDELIEKETERQHLKSEAEKEAWMQEKEAARRRRRELAQEAKEKERRDKLAEAMKGLSNRNLSIDEPKVETPKKTAAAKLKRVQAEADELREEWKAARSKTRAAKKKNPESHDTLKEEEDKLFNKWVAKRQEVKEAENALLKETEEEEKKEVQMTSVEDVWAALSELEEEAAQIAREG
mmetsp:Transcript_39144/g.94632  ORF Transcript_39144/g.94632 Transcript_39144/m.94632 type:complete len:677 (+) Transcript_39144:135-2165(+)